MVNLILKAQIFWGKTIFHHECSLRAHFETDLKKDTQKKKKKKNRKWPQIYKLNNHFLAQSCLNYFNM